VNWFGAAILAICGFHLACGMFTGRIPARWPTFAADRDSNPTSFRFYMAVYGIGAIAGAVIILLSLS